MPRGFDIPLEQREAGEEAENDRLARLEGACQHDPLAVCCTLLIESSSLHGSRIRCWVCDRSNQIGLKTGRIDPMGAFPHPTNSEPR